MATSQHEQATRYAYEGSLKRRWHSLVNLEVLGVVLRDIPDESVGDHAERAFQGYRFGRGKFGKKTWVASNDRIA